MAAVDGASTSAQTLIAEGLEPSADSGQLNPKHRIFLSHNGADKNFVRHLCEHLERVHHYPFFDVRGDCLPKPKKFAQLISQAAQQCQLAILVVSEKYFMSKWPMLELASFVEAQKFINPRLEILPLFYGLTVAELGEPGRQECWFKVWKKLARSDKSGMIDMAKWRAALKVVGAANGLEFAVHGQNEVEYIKKIVAATCRLVPIDMRWNESHVQGKRRLRSSSRPTVSIPKDMAAVDEASTSAQTLITGGLESSADSGQLNPKHRIFLSQSGADKNFVRHLCEHLERIHHYPFFDVRDDSLPKGMKFAQLIFQAAQQCQLAILVVSEKYFMSRWPMLELASFVEAQKSNNPRLEILPLFYGLTVAQFGEPERQECWFKAWEKLAQSDASGRIDTAKWRAALKVVGASNGLELAVYGKNEVEYIKKIVAATCRLVPINMRWNESHVQGKRHLRSASWRMFEKSVPSVKFGCRVVGLYGMGGIGKTTLCKSLCNDFFKEFVGKVCHLEISSNTKTPIESQKEVLQALTEASDELLKVITDIDKGQSLYVERIWRQKVFLSLENVWDSFEPLAEAAAYLEAKFSADSKILVTARSLNTLLKLGINRDSCFEMPHLEEDDAVALFLHYALPGRSISDFKDPDELEVLRRCVRRALFGKGVASNSTSERHFHPLALKVLGLHFATTSSFPLGWIKKLNQFDWKRFEEVGDPIFSVLRTSYDALPTKMHRSMFLDAAIYAPRKPDNTVPTVKQLCKWLSIVYEADFKDVLARLEDLRSRALLFEWNNLSEAVSIHDLYREFAEFELRGDNEDHLRLLHQGVDTVPKLLRKNPVLGNFLFERICIRNVGVESFDKAKLLLCSNVEVLKLDFCYALPNLDLQGLTNLCSLELYGCFELTNLLHLWELENLIWMRWNTCNFLRSGLVFSTSLQILELFGVSKDSSVVEPPDIQGCKFLRELTLKDFPELEHFPELSGLKRLLKVDFGGCTKVKSLILDDQCRLEKLNLQNCRSLEILCLPPYCATLMKLRCRGCESLVEIRNITDCRKFEVFELEGCGKLMFQPANTLQTLTGL